MRSAKSTFKNRNNSPLGIRFKLAGFVRRRSDLLWIELLLHHMNAAPAPFVHCTLSPSALESWAPDNCLWVHNYGPFDSTSQKFRASCMAFFRLGWLQTNAGCYRLTFLMPWLFTLFTIINSVTRPSLHWNLLVDWFGQFRNHTQIYLNRALLCFFSCFRILSRMKLQFPYVRALPLFSVLWQLLPKKVSFFLLSDQVQQ